MTEAIQIIKVSPDITVDRLKTSILSCFRRVLLLSSLCSFVRGFVLSVALTLAASAWYAAFWSSLSDDHFELMSPSETLLADNGGEGEGKLQIEK